MKTLLIILAIAVFILYLCGRNSGADLEPGSRTDTGNVAPVRHDDIMPPTTTDIAAGTFYRTGTAGTGTAVNRDWAELSAQFNNFNRIAAKGSGNLYIVDFQKNKPRRIMVK